MKRIREALAKAARLISEKLGSGPDSAAPRANAFASSNEHLCQLLFDKLPQEMFFKDANSVYVAVNESFAADLKRPKDQIIGKKDIDLFPKPLADKFHAADLEIFASGKTMEADESYHIDGKDKTIRITKIPIYGDSRRLLGILGIFWDITEQKKLEELLFYFKQTVDTSLDAVGMSTPEGRHFYQNEAFTKLFGLSVSQTDGASGPPSTIYADEAAGREVFDTIMRGRRWNGEAKMLDKDKNIIDVMIMAAPIKDDDGRIVGLVGAHEDITARKKNQEELLYFKKAVDSASDGIAMALPDGRHFYQNEAFTRMFGAPLSQMQGINARESGFYTDPDLRGRIFKTLMQGLPWNGEVRMRGRHGRELDVFLKAYAIRDAEGKIIGLVGMHTDITERRRKEEIQRKLELESQASAAANKAKSYFLATMSHELRTPLNAIIASADMLGANMLGTLNEKQREYVAHMHASGHHLLSLINDILDLTKIEADKMELSPGTVNLRRLADSVAQMMRPAAEAAGVQLSARLDVPQNAPATADERKLKQVLINLTSNAIKFSASGGTVRLELAVLGPEKLDALAGAGTERSLPQAGSYLLAQVRDTGIGIRAEDMSKLFKPFSQVDASDSRSYSGTGLGLAMAKKLVELHKGRIWAESEYGKGTTMSFIIPLDPPITR